MKLFKSNNRTKQWTWITMFLIEAISLGIISCSEDDSKDVDLSDGQEVESAWITGYFISAPEGRIWYMEATEDINSDVDISNSVELGSNASVRSYGENVYTTSFGAGTLTKWGINKSTLELEVEGIMSYASTGIDFLTGLIFKSDSEAYAFRATEGVIVEFNPTKMGIIDTYNVPTPLNIDDEAIANSSDGYLRGDNILYPIDYSPLNPGGDATGLIATLAVFNTNTKAFIYVQDSRSSNLASRQGLVTATDGFNYIWPMRENAMYAQYWNNTPNNPHTVLRVDDDGIFDQSYELNLDEVIDDFSITMRPVIAFQDEVLFTYYTTSLNDFTWDDRYNFFDNTSDARIVRLNLLTGEYSTATAFDVYAEVEFQNNIDGVNYIRAYNQDYTKTYTLRQNGIDSYEQLQGADNGVIMYTNKLF
ncbi:MAG: hypothetical protein AAGI25_10760 [Bacteroidota bacterium]